MTSSPKPRATRDLPPPVSPLPHDTALQEHNKAAMSTARQPSGLKAAAPLRNNGRINPKYTQLDGRNSNDHTTRQTPTGHELGAPAHLRQGRVIEEPQTTPPPIANILPCRDDT